MIKLETKNLIIRDSIWKDIEIFYNWELMPEVHNFFSIPQNQTYESVVRTYINDGNDFSKKQLTIVEKKDNTPIGRIVLSGLEKNWKVEIFRIYIGNLSFRKKGYGKQSMEALLNLFFTKWNMERVYLDHYDGNPVSNLYLSLGFKYEGILRKNCKKDDILHDVHLMSILKNEFLEKNNLSLKNY